jgi:hypothetical protein
MSLLGYGHGDADNMIQGLAAALTTINSDDDPWLYNSIWIAKDLLEGLQTEGRFEVE